MNVRTVTKVASSTLNAVDEPGVGLRLVLTPKAIYENAQSFIPTSAERTIQLGRADIWDKSQLVAVFTIALSAKSCDHEKRTYPNRGQELMLAQEFDVMLKGLQQAAQQYQPPLGQLCGNDAITFPGSYSVIKECFLNND